MDNGSASPDNRTLTHKRKRAATTPELSGLSEWLTTSFCFQFQDKPEKSKYSPKT